MLVRRKRQIAILVTMAVSMIAIIVGLSVGLTVKRPVPTSEPTTDVPTLSPTSWLDRDFMPALPRTPAIISKNMSSPRYRAFEWATEVEQVPSSETPDNDP
jgi:hypothetical protein